MTGDPMAGALAGVRVVDLTSYIAGSYGAMMLADLGAGVIKVEAIEGDSFRELPGFYGWNRGKRSIAVNVKDPDGRAIVHRLAREADVVMENMRPGVVERLGVAPQYLRIAVTDYYCAALNCQMVLAALFARERTGKGQRVQTSLLQAVLALQSGNVVAYPGHEVVYRPTPTYRLYQGSDGEWFFLAVGNQSFWVKLCKAVGLEDLAQDPRFGSWFARRDNAEALMPLLEEAFGSRPAAEWVRVLTAHDIPAAATQSLQEFMRDPAVLHHEMIVEYDHPELGPLTLMGQPLRFSETQAPDAGPPPLLGQHTAQVLREAGYADPEIAELRRRGVVAGKDISP